MGKFNSESLKKTGTEFCPRLLWRIITFAPSISFFPPTVWSLCPSVPSPSSLIDLGSDTAKHCMVSYFCGWGSCSCCSSWLSLCGLTSIRQLNVWLFLLGPSLDHGTPFTARGVREVFFRDLQCGEIYWIYFFTAAKSEQQEKRRGSQERLTHCKWKT